MTIDDLLEEDEPTTAAPTKAPVAASLPEVHLAPGEHLTLNWDYFSQCQHDPDFALRNSPIWNDGSLATDEWAAIVEQVHRETHWERQQEVGELPEYQALVDHQEAVASKHLPCPLCHGTDDVYLLHRGADTGLEISLPVSCPCRIVRSISWLWGDVPQLYRTVSLRGLAPSTESILPRARQQEIIKQLQAQPDDSYFLYGPPKTGKTHMSFALYRRAVSVWAFADAHIRQCTQSCWRVRTSTLLDQHIAWSTRNVDDESSTVRPPTVATWKIQAAVKHGYRPALFLDEIDKFKPSDYKFNILIQLVDAIYEADGQVVATSNKGIADLIDKWGADEAGTILRRIGAGPNAHTIQFS
jgi:hypothetical protein